MFTVPSYTLKRLYNGHLHVDSLLWICDFSRLTYFVCGHQLKVSLLLVSFDRLIATKFPYRYKELVTKKLAALAVVMSWAFVVSIDLIPFFPLGKGHHGNDRCTYVPQHCWSIAVISVFNVLVFFLISVNYIIVWRVTVGMTLKDHTQRLAVKRMVSVPAAGSLSSTHSSPNLINCIDQHENEKRYSNRSWWLNVIEDTSVSESERHFDGCSSDDHRKQRKRSPMRELSLHLLSPRQHEGKRRSSECSARSHEVEKRERIADGMMSYSSTISIAGVSLMDKYGNEHPDAVTRHMIR